MVGSEIYKTTLEDKYTKGRFKEKNIFTLNFDFDLPCRTSPKQCSPGSPGGGVKFLPFETCI